MDYYQAIVLGLLQGATEFLPISSSGHLALLSHIYRMPEQVRLGLSAALHVGTVFSLLVYFGPRLLGIARGAFARERETRAASRRYIALVAVATVPAALAGLLVKPVIERAFVNPALIGAMLLLTGTLLFVTRFRRENGRTTGWWRAILVGAAQALALLPGISRSGATISTGLLLGMKRQEAFEFSFIMAVPVTAVASVLELADLDLKAVAPGPIALGILLAFLSGLLALALLRRAVLGRRFYLFGLYCWLAGLAAIVLLR